MIRILVTLVFLSGILKSSFTTAQMSITSTGIPFIIDFDATVAGVNNGVFAGSGFQPAPSTGQLDSDGWKVTGLSDGDLSFGATGTTGDYARGASAGGVITGGIYAFGVNAGDTALGIQPIGTDWTPGTIVLKIQNNTGSFINTLNISYYVYVLNNEDRSNSFNFSHSFDDISYTNAGSLDYVSPDTADITPAWTGIKKTITLSFPDIPNIPDGDFYYLRWSGGDVGGSGSRDEFALDSVSVTADFIPVIPTKLAFTNIPGNCIITDSTFSVTVCAVDSAGVVDITYSDTITISKASGSGTLSGILAIAASSGCATFNDLSLDSADTYSLIAGDSTLANDTSKNIYVADSCGKCFEIQSILVDACNPNYAFHCENGIQDVDETGVDCGGADCVPCPGSGLPPGAEEGENEMVRFQVGQNDLLTSDIFVNWPNNPWLGICQDSVTADIVDSINSTITGGGMVYEPAGGVIPAGATVILVTSTTFDWQGHNWSNLNYDVYMLFQCAGNTQGHFINYNIDTVPRTLVIGFTGYCSDTVSYIPNQLSNTDGAGVDFDPDGNPAYGNNGCQPPIFPVAVFITISSTNNICNGNCAGTATAIMSGGVPPFTYAWNTNPVQTDSIATGLCQGTYTVTVTDIASTTIIDSVTITEPAALSLITASATSTCGNADGSAWVNVTGGTFPYSYIWNDSLLQITDTADSLPSGSYTVIVTDTNGCIDSASAMVNDAGAPSVIIDSTKNISCNGSNNGAVYISVSGGTLPYTYLWSNADTIEDIDSLTAGTYTITVTDSNNCSSVQNINLTEPPALNLTITDTNNATCGLPNGSATVTPSGGVPLYSYLWNTFIPQTDSTAIFLTPGLYTVTVTDSNGCSDSVSVTINGIAGPSIVIVSATDVSCNGGNDGSINIFVFGGAEPYSYLWTNFTDTIGFTEDIDSLTAGTYLITVTDSNLCIAAISEPIIEPTAIAISMSSSAATCGNNNGSLTVTPGGGTAPYTLLWDDPASQTTPTAAALAAGAYNVIVMDSKGCTNTGNGAVDNIGGPTIDSLEITDESCPGLKDGALNTTVTGGTLPYTYLWSNGESTGALQGVSAGAYEVIVTDAIGCIASDTATVNALQVGCLNIPSSFSPNGDGINDKWLIRGIELYPEINVEVYNRWGSLMFSSKGYAEPWDAIFNGEPVPSATYYFIIILDENQDAITGTVTIVR